MLRKGVGPSRRSKTWVMPVQYQPSQIQMLCTLSSKHQRVKEARVKARQHPSTLLCHSNRASRNSSSCQPAKLCVSCQQCPRKAQEQREPFMVTCQQDVALPSSNPQHTDRCNMHYCVGIAVGPGSMRQVTTSLHGHFSGKIQAHSAKERDRPYFIGFRHCFLMGFYIPAQPNIHKIKTIRQRQSHLGIKE